MVRNGSTTRWRKTRARARQRDASTSAPCWLDGQPIDYTLTTGEDMWAPDHYWPVSTHPHLEHDLANLRPSHVRCNRARGNKHPDEVMAGAMGTRSRDW